MKGIRVTTLILSLIVSTVSIASASELVVYSARKEHLIKPLFTQYEKETGTTIRYITGKAPVLLQRLLAEGENSPADMLITVDAGNLWHAAQKGILAPVDSPLLQANIPSHYRDPENRWFGLSIRARTLVYNPERATPEELSTYQELASPKWRGRLLLRTSKKVYNQSLVAMLIKERGRQETADTVTGWVNNLAAPPFSSDTKVLEAVAAGQGDVGIVNTYYFGRLLKKKPDLPLRIFWPDQNGNGVHVNISGAGITRHAKHRAEAVRFLEWLSGKTAQHLFADANMEYPANPEVSPHPTVASWGTFKESTLNLTHAGALQADAIKLMDHAGYR